MAECALRALKSSFDSSPSSIWVVLRDDDSNLATNADMEVGDAGEQDTVFFAVCFNIVGAVVLDKCTNDLFAFDWANLLIDKSTVVGDG